MTIVQEITPKGEEEWKNILLDAKIVRTELCNWQERLASSRCLRKFLQRDGAAFLEVLQDVDAALALICAPDPVMSDMSSTDLARYFRRQKRLLVLLLASIDYGRIIAPQPDILQQTQYLSQFAATAVDQGLLRLMQEAGFADHTGICVLGMGKLGGGELNYSSDIDIIVLFDAAFLVEKLGEDAYRKVQRVVRNLVTFMETPDAEGYIFRTDLRLRPDPSSTPPAVEVEAAVQYYESMGLAWERAAMLKARHVAGDGALAASFLERIKPFVWRRSLDYASVDDIRAIRTRAIKRHDLQNVDGANVKLIEGGIREIELFAQMSQLIWGGRKSSLQVLPTLDALNALVQEEILERAVEQKLAQAYCYFRRLEHAAQLLDDHQRHDLPSTDEEWQRFATLMDSTPEQITQKFRQQVRIVRAICVPEAEQDEGNENPDLAEVGFRDPDTVGAITERWLAGRYRVTATERARRLLAGLLPRLLRAFAATVAPDDALARMDKFLEALPAGVQLFSLFSATPELLRYCADIMGNAPRLALLLQQKPRLFEYLLHNDQAPLPVLPIALSGLEETLDDCRRLAQEVEFRCSVGFMSSRMRSGEMYQHLSQTAEVVIGQTLRALRAESPKLPKANFAIIALGKLGRRQLMPDSDLDLVFISRPEEDEGGMGYMRLAQRLLNGLSVQTSEGGLYEVDMRLRPHGDSGMLCSQWDSVQKYYDSEAWLWEYYAFSQARVLYADGDFEADVRAWLLALQTRPHNAEDLRDAVREMRPKISAAFPVQGLWDVKHQIGGVMDGGFCLQYWQMLLAPNNPALIGAETDILLGVAAESGLLPKAEVAPTLAAWNLLLELQMGLRVSGGGQSLRIDDAPPGQRKLLCRVAGCTDFANLERRLQDSYQQIAKIYQMLF